jgi:dTDP-4-dehydrorhamnose reductase
MERIIVTNETPHLFCFGLGYSAGVFARACSAQGWRISGTHRGKDGSDQSTKDGFKLYPFDRATPLIESQVLEDVTHLLVSVPPDGEGCPVADILGAKIAQLPNLTWLGYLSTTGVYGNTDGESVDENAPLNPSSDRSRFRVNAEEAWLKLWRDNDVPVHIFRLAGIYGPGRSPLDRVRSGNATRTDKPGQLFSRIYVDDISTVLRASIDRPRPGAVYNVCDDDPASPADVVAYACDLLGSETPPKVAFEEAAKSMSPMALSFWRDNRRVDNALIKKELSVQLAYPNYRQGLAAVLKAEAS